MITYNKRNKTGRNIRESQLDQILKGVRDFFHHTNRDETIRPEMQRFEILQFPECRTRAITTNER